MWKVYDGYVVEAVTDGFVLRFSREEPAYYFRDGERAVGDSETVVGGVFKPRGITCNWTPFLSRAMRMTRADVDLLISEIVLTNNHCVKL